MLRAGTTTPGMVPSAEQLFVGGNQRSLRFSPGKLAFNAMPGRSAEGTRKPQVVANAEKGILD